jgi:hypothetical protein|tara:strand:- start:753 stop:1556 length:804 start_codon:yes stop_codon:yes gene_type:complete
MKRKRTLSHQGCELFNVALINHQQKTCMRNIIYTLFSSDFDEKLKKSLEKFRSSSYKLYSYLNKNNITKIPEYFDNAVGNLIYLILVNDNNINNIRQIKKNLLFYYTLAEKAFETKDHNTAILIKAALDNTVIKRLNIKLTKKQVKIQKKFIENYGTFMNCNSIHLKKILENSEIDFLPSIAILLMHYKKSKEYYKCYTKLGHFPESLKDKNEQLEKIVDNYYEQYKNYNIKLQDVYIKDPRNLELMKKLNEKSTSINLFEISRSVK